jgi:hypothetical protein
MGRLLCICAVTLFLVGCSSSEKYLTNEDFFKHVQSYCETTTNEGHPERAPGTQFVKCLHAWGYK